MADPARSLLCKSLTSADLYLWPGLCSFWMWQWKAAYSMKKYGFRDCGTVLRRPMQTTGVGPRRQEGAIATTSSRLWGIVVFFGINAISTPWCNDNQVTRAGRPTWMNGCVEDEWMRHCGPAELCVVGTGHVFKSGRLSTWQCEDRYLSGEVWRHGASADVGPGGTGGYGRGIVC